MHVLSKAINSDKCLNSESIAHSSTSMRMSPASAFWLAVQAMQDVFLNLQTLTLEQYVFHKAKLLKFCFLRFCVIFRSLFKVLLGMRSFEHHRRCVWLPSVQFPKLVLNFLKPRLQACTSTVQASVICKTR